MDAQRWEQVQSLFLAALERDPDERAGFLERASVGDPELGREVRTLLACHGEDQALAIEGRLLVDEGDPLPEGDGEQLVNTRVGPYRLLRRIGRGGMGDVYLAGRDEPYQQEVAVKLVRLGFQQAETVRRFRAEQQILARMAHSNIARLFDGGVTDDGRPYLVMEYIVGLPITEYCDRRRASINDRLRSFCAVCEAVQFAHRNLIVHRDVKPSNVLVTESGEVKLLDFGIAKLLDPASAGLSLTQTAVRVMTPEYAAPEQVRGDPITTATDVYALGVLLYELITGHLPHHFSTGAPAEIERVICDEQPSWPSAAVSLRQERPTSDGASRVLTPERVSADRGTQPARLQRALRGDLDNIVMMALRREPERRYASAAQLAEDIQRYLSGQPVIARKDTAGYRVRKFVRRNRAAVVLGAGVFALVLGFGVVMTAQAGALARERDRAQLEATKAMQVAGFLENLFEAPDPFAASAERRDTMRVRDVLVQGAEKVRADLETQPPVQAQLLNVLGSVFESLGDLAAAAPLLEQALTLREQTYGGEHLEVAESQHELAMLRKAEGRASEAESLLRSALATRSALLGNEHADIASSLNALATVLHDQGDLAGADSLYRDALMMRRRVFGTESLDVATILNNLSTLSYQRGDFVAADSLVREALAVRRSLLGVNHPEVAMTMAQLAGVSGQRMDQEEAETLLRDALRILREALGPEHPDVARTLNNLAGFLRTKGDYEAAEPLYREALALWRTLLGDEHPNVALTLYNLGALLKAKGDLEGAERLHRDALAMRRRLLGETHPSVAASLNNLGVLLKEKGEYDEAISLLRQAIALNTEALGPGHHRVARTTAHLGEVFHALRRYEEAERLFLDALDMWHARADANDPSVIEMHERLYRLYRDWEKPEQAERYESLIREADSTSTEPVSSE